MFENRTVWITGASSGIGQALAIQFADKGAKVILSSRRKNELERVGGMLKGGLDKHIVLPLDLANSENLSNALAVYHEDLKHVDILINNGGISQRSFFVDTDLSVFRNLMEINYLGTVALTKYVLPTMLENKRGTIVSISSVAGKVGSKLRTAYSGSKFAVVGFMDCLRAEVSGNGIQCLTVCPGSINTQLAINALDGEGNAQNRNDKSIINGMKAEDCAKEIIKTINAGKDEVVIGKGISAMSPTIKRFFPGMFNYLSARSEYR